VALQPAFWLEHAVKETAATAISAMIKNLLFILWYLELKIA
jgi:hypothetical protein